MRGRKYRDVDIGFGVLTMKVGTTTCVSLTTSGSRALGTDLLIVQKDLQFLEIICVEL
jgi:hypothetical protein